MAKNRKTNKKKHVPQRTCVGCRTVEEKRNMIRIVRSQEGVQIDPSGKLAGRGAYIHQSHNCWLRAAKGSLSKALHTDLTEQDMELLQGYFEAFADPVPERTNDQTIEHHQS